MTAAPHMAEAMKPCPFCGGEASTWTTSAASCDSADHVLGCEDCGFFAPFASVFESREVPQSAIAAWNRRAPDEKDAEIARLREALAGIASMTDPDDPNSYRSDDREGCLDTVHACARILSALSPT